MTYNIQKIAAFSDKNKGGNPAGVVIADKLPDTKTMQDIAKSVGFSETALATPIKDAWRVRYFSPESEVPFCGHATIALGAALAMQNGDNTFNLTLNEANISVSGKKEGDIYAASLQSPPTQSKNLSQKLTTQILKLFNYTTADLNPDLPPAFASAGATHAIITLKTRQQLKNMTYNLAEGRKLMTTEGLVTIAFIYVETPQIFHVRNAFASGGVLEDPATGAAAAAFSGYLRDINWQHNSNITLIQGEDMGIRSIINAQIPPTKTTSIKVSGTARVMT